MSESKKLLDALGASSIRAAVPPTALGAAMADLSGTRVAALQLELPALSLAVKGLAIEPLNFSRSLADSLQRAVLGPMEDLKRFGVIEPIVLPGIDLAQLTISMDALNASFRLPELTEWKDLTAQALRASSLAIDLSLTSSIEKAMKQMSTPWLDAAHANDSARGFADMQILGASLDRLPPFADTLSKQLREALGDWREVIVDTSSGLDGIEARMLLYQEQGLDSALSGFPAPAFEQATTIARIQQPPATLIVLYDYVIPARDDQEALGFERTNQAHDRLQRFETRVREFIEAQMSKVFGAKWIKQRVPPDVRAHWIEKAEKALNHGDIVRPLIAYADFTDYEKIICRADNWREVFLPHFVRPEAVLESFQRLYPVRLATMHGRLITQDDQILLYIETKRLLKAMGV